MDFWNVGIPIPVALAIVAALGYWIGRPQPLPHRHAPKKRKILRKRQKVPIVDGRSISKRGDSLMVGPTALLALWLVAATPTATPASREQSVVIRCSAQDDSPFREELPGGSESPKRVPKSKYDPSYDAGQTPPSPAANIPALKPAEEGPGEAVVGDSPSDAPCYDGPACVEPRDGWLRGIRYEGWLDQGATINVLSPRNRTNGPVTFNDRSNDYQLNQFYLRLKRDVEQDSDAWDVGGRDGQTSTFTTDDGRHRRGRPSRSRRPRRRRKDGCLEQGR